MSCLFPDCDVKVAGRGLCMPHYHTARYLVMGGRTTWESLVKRGKALPTRADRRDARDSWFMEGEA